MKNLSEKHVLPTKILLNVPEETEKQTTSGIIIPGTANKISSLGSAVIVGCAVNNNITDNPIQVDTEIMFSPHAGIKVKHESEEYVLINITDVLLYW